MNFQRQDLAGAIRTKSFLEPVPVKMHPSWQDILFRILFVLALAILGGVLIAQTGCTAPLISSNIDINANGNTVPVSTVP